MKMGEERDRLMGKKRRRNGRGEVAYLQDKLQQSVGLT